MKALLALATSVALAAAPQALAEKNDRAPIKLTTTGAAAQGFFAVVIEAIHAVIRDAYPGSTITFQPNSVGGGMLATAEGKADISIGLPPVEVQAALAGEKPFQTSLKGKLFHVMTILDNLDFAFVANKAWAEKHKIQSFADFARVKPPVRFGASARATFYINAAMEGIMKEYGYSFADIEKWGGRVFYGASGTLVQDIRDGKIDAFVTGALQPDPRLAEVAKSMDLVWIKTDKTVLEKVAKTLDLEVAPMRKGTYAFLGEDVWNLRAPTTTAAGPSASAETIYKMLKAIDGNMERIRSIHPTFRTFSLAKMAKPHPRLPYHPGAEQYYREKGAIK